MYQYLKGKLIEKNPASVIVECNGVGYVAQISLHTFSQLSDDELCLVYVHQQITEDAHTLWGFATDDERRLFKILISVSGVGCNTARMMLSSMNPSEIEEYIASENVARLKSIKGIGEKTAQRIVLELKSKVKKDAALNAPVSELRIKDEAATALLTLGFSKPAIDKTLGQLLKQNATNSVEELIREALKII